jgi:predicted ATPase
MISRVEALNYRGLGSVSQDLGPLQILVGPNASGKSTFLDVIALLSDFVKDGLDEAVLFRYGSEKGRASRLDELIFNQRSDQFKLGIQLVIPEHLRSIDGDGFQSEVAHYEVIIGKTDKGELGVQAESLQLYEDSELPVPHSATPISASTSRNIIRKIIYKKAVFSPENRKRSMQLPTGLRKSALSVLPDDPDRFPIATWVRDLLLEGVRVLALNGTAMRRPVSPSAARNFSAEGANLPLVIRDLQTDHPQSYQDWLAHIRSILPDIKKIRVVERTDDRHLYLAISYENGGDPVPSWLVSDGTLRLLALTLIPYVPEQRTGVFLIEEPENGVHPKVLEGIFESLSSVYDGQVLIATHSPMFMALGKLEQILCFTKNDVGGIQIVRGDDHPILQNWRGEIDLSILYAGGVLG